MKQEVVREPEFPKSNRKQTQTRLLAQTVDLLSVNGNPDSLTTSKPHSECYPALIPRHTQVVTGRRYLMYQTNGVTEDAYPGSSFYDTPGVSTHSYALQLFHTLPPANHDMRKRWYPVCSVFWRDV